MGHTPVRGHSLFGACGLNVVKTRGPPCADMPVCHLPQRAALTVRGHFFREEVLQAQTLRLRRCPQSARRSVPEQKCVMRHFLVASCRGLVTVCAMRGRSRSRASTRWHTRPTAQDPRGCYRALKMKGQSKLQRPACRIWLHLQCV